MPFNDMQLKNLKTRSTPYRVWEHENDEGFNIQVRPNGTKTFYFFYTFNGKRRFMRLGKYTETKKRPKDSHPITEARDKLRDAKKLLERGIDPQVAREEAKLRNIREHEEAEQNAIKEKNVGTIKQLLDTYTAQLKADNKSSWVEIERAFRKNVFCTSNEINENKIPENMKAKDITPQHIRKVLFIMVSRGADTGANHLRAYLSAAFSHGIRYDLDPKNLANPVMFHLERNPVRDVPRPRMVENVGERNLNWEEIQIFWNNIGRKDSLPQPQNAIAYKGRLPQETKDLILRLRKENPHLGKYNLHDIIKKRYGLNISISAVGRVISSNLQKKKIEPTLNLDKPAIAAKLILITGQRVSEVLSAGPNDFNFDTKIWEILETKNGRVHAVPLTDLSISLLKPLIDEAKAEGRKHLFPMRGPGQNGEKEECMRKSSFSHYLRRFCASIEPFNDKNNKSDKSKKIVPRDLRRTWKTRTGEIGISKYIRDRIQNHAMSDVSSKHYDRYEYLPEKREAMDKWDKHLQTLFNQVNQKS